MSRSLRMLASALVTSTAAMASECIPTETATVVPGDLALGALFATEVAAEGGTAVAGAIGEPASNGSLYVLASGRDGWGDVARLLPSDLGAGSFSMALGWSVAIGDGVILGGAPFFDGDGIGFGEGAAFVFRRIDGVWQEQAILTASDGVNSDGFGLATAVSDDVAVVGAPGVDGDAGAVYVYRYDGITWGEEAKLTGSDTVTEDAFGLGVALDGATVYVGAVGDGAIDAPGRVYVFEHDGETWCETALLNAWDTNGHNGFGAQVKADGNRLIVGATGDDARANDAGAAYIFEHDGATWQPVAKLTASDAHAGQGFGVEVDVRGDLAVVSAHLDDASEFQGGAAYAFCADASGWVELAKLTASDGAAEDRFGDGLALAGRSLLIGAPFRDEPAAQTGAVYTFDLCPCPADVDGNGDVGFADLLKLLGAWGPCAGCSEDIDDDGEVGLTDLLIVLSSWGRCW